MDGLHKTTLMQLLECLIYHSLALDHRHVMDAENWKVEKNTFEILTSVENWAINTWYIVPNLY